MITYLSKIIRFNNVTVLGVFKTDKKDVYYILEVKKIANKLNIISSKMYEDIDILIQNINIKHPILLAIDGKGVLNKKIEFENEIDNNWRKNLDLSTIYFTDYRTAKNSFMSFCRKKIVDDLIVSLQNKNLDILEFYIGPVLTVFFRTTILQDKIYANDSVLNFDDSGILLEVLKDNDLVEKNYNFGSSELSRYHISLYGAALNFFIAQKEISKSESDFIKCEEIIYKKSFNFLSIVMLVLFFLALLTSYFLIQFYSAKNAELNQRNIYSNQTYLQIKSLEKQREQKIKILAATGQLSKHFLTHYAYELSKAAPNTIQINNINIFPALKEIKIKKKVDIESNIILLKGATAAEPSLNDYINKFKDMRWIKKFEVVYIKKDKKNIEQFEIKIQVDDF